MVSEDEANRPRPTTKKKKAAAGRASLRQQRTTWRAACARQPILLWIFIVWYAAV